MPPRRLTIKGPTYYSEKDEAAFFDWLLSISCISEVEGDIRDLHIRFKRQPADAELRELIALFWRYRIGMKSLATLKTQRNAAWFAHDPSAYWHSKVFGSAR